METYRNYFLPNGKLFSRKMKENYTFEAVWDALGDMLMDEHERVSLLSLSS